MPIFYDGKEFEDQAQFEVHTNPDVPPTIKVLITKPPAMPPEAPTEPAGALKPPQATEVAPEVQAAPAPSMGTVDNNYNTPLTPDEQADYDTKFKPQDSEEYDMQGWYKKNPTVVPNTPGVHYPDTFKKPNHPTFSDQSQYHNDTTKGGQWTNDDTGADVFTPGPQNLANGLDKTKSYLAWADPKVKLNYQEPASGPSIVNTVKGMLSGPNTDEDKKILTGLYDTVKNAFGLTQAPPWAVDQTTGEVHTSPQAISKAADLAGLMTFGPAPVASKMADGTLGSFVGVKAKTFDKTRLYKAQQLEMDGVHPDDVWKQTGTFKGADGQWRQEVEDRNLNILASGTQLHPAEVNKGWDAVGEKPEMISVRPSLPKLKDDASIEDILRLLKTPTNQLRLENVLDHPELYKAYPWLRGIKVHPMPEGDKSLGMVRGGEIFMNKLPSKEGGEEAFHSVLMHEVQHVIQQHEGFATGGNTGQFLPAELKAAKAELPRLEKEYIDQMKIDQSSLDHYKKMVRFTQDTPRDKMSHGIQQAVDAEIEEMKKNGYYQGVKNLVDSEDLLKKAGMAAYEKYSAIMGEVEARNVQKRLDFDGMKSLIESPKRTEEELVSRSKQIHPKDVSQHILGN